MTTTDSVLAIDGMHCASCGLLVDETLEDLDGVTRSTTDTRRGHARVEFDPSIVTLDEITSAISDLGYRATPKKAVRPEELR